MEQMPLRVTDRTMWLRIIENWLPLAQIENVNNRWGFDGPGLEHLIKTATPALQQATTMLAARAILWHYREQIMKEIHE